LDDRVDSSPDLPRRRDDGAQALTAIAPEVGVDPVWEEVRQVGAGAVEELRRPLLRAGHALSGVGAAAAVQDPRSQRWGHRVVRTQHPPHHLAGQRADQAVLSAISAASVGRRVARPGVDAAPAGGHLLSREPASELGRLLNA
jgi:hypothetical protein